MLHPDDSAGYSSESGDSVLDMSIVGDEEEEARIRLESNLQDLSIQLSATNPSSYSSEHEGGQAHKSMRRRQAVAHDDDDTSSEVEYPRHDPQPRETSIFQGYSSPSHVDNDYDPNYYSYRTADDDDLRHFAADTMSTAAHHTSALSLNAGLAGRGGRRAFDTSGDWTPRPKHFSKKPDLTVQPPTPTSIGSPPSKFSRIAQDLAKDIEAGERLASSMANAEKARGKRRTRRPPVQETTMRSEMSYAQQPARSASKYGPSLAVNDARTRSVHLPDVTGLTSAIGSPMKGQRDWRKYEGKGNSEGMDALLRNLTKLQARLNDLEDQNLLSRRRVRELELELEACKVEVKRERTRVMEREEIIVAQQRQVDKSRAKNKASVAGPSAAESERLTQIIEEKKALEALVTSLRSHLARLTAELASQQELLHELQSLRETDLRAVNEKMGEVDILRRQVERLGGEVEVLRGVVEAGLNERRKFRDGLSFSMGGDGEVSGEKEDGGRFRMEELEKEDESEEEVVKPHPRPALKSRTRAADRQKETRRAMVVSPHIQSTVDSEQSENQERVDERKQERLIDFEESDSAEHHAGDSNEPNTSFSRNISAPRRSVVSPEPEYDREEPSRMYGRVASTSRIPANTSEETEKMADDNEEEEDDAFRPPSRPLGPTPRRGLRTSSPKRQRTPHPSKFHKQHSEPTDVPFPQIRGERLERLFFSAPDHDASTCNVCRRRKRMSRGGARGRRHSGTSEEGEVDEGFEDGDEDVHEHQHAHKHCRSSKTDMKRERDRWEKVGRCGVGFGEDKTPPQTVVVRVLRELEDDFTHYKGIYVELADQYKLMDAISNVPKRNVLAEHLKEVIDVLEQKGDQIAALYDCLEFKDKPIAESLVYGKASTRT